LEDKQTMSCFLWKLEKLCSRTDHFPHSIPSKIDAYPRGLASISAPLMNNRWDYRHRRQRIWSKP
jgi:hypothetical protein